VARDMVARMLMESGVIDAADLPEAWLLPDPAAQRELK